MTNLIGCHVSRCCAPTDFDPLEAEERIIAAIQGATVTLDRPLTYWHWSKVQTLGTTGATLDRRAEVANLTRNITVRGANAAGSTFGGHLMFMDGLVTRLSNIEVTGIGQLGKLGRYPSLEDHQRRRLAHRAGGS